MSQSLGLVHRGESYNFAFDRFEHIIGDSLTVELDLEKKWAYYVNTYFSVYFGRICKGSLPYIFGNIDKCVCVREGGVGVYPQNNEFSSKFIYPAK